MQIAHDFPLFSPRKKGDSYVLTYNDYEDEAGNARKGVKKTLEVRLAKDAYGKMMKDELRARYEMIWT